MTASEAPVAPPGLTSRGLVVNDEDAETDCTCDSVQQGTVGDPGILGYETMAAARAARAAVAYLDDDARWALLQKWLEAESAGLREAGERSLRLEALRSMVCPRVSDREWNRILREHWPVRWADQLRLANALAAARSRPALAGNT